MSRRPSGWAAPIATAGNAATTDKLAGHVAPRDPALWRSSANPRPQLYALNRERPEFVRFVNPGDLRVADQSCGTSTCHGAIVDKVRTSLMSHGAFLWGAALYNNGALPAESAPSSARATPATASRRS